MKKINMYDKIMIENQKKRENMEIREILQKKSPSKRWFINGIHDLLKRAGAREGSDVFYRMWRISLVYGSGIVIDVKSRSRTDYLMLTDNILVFDWYFNLTNKSNIIGKF